MIILGSGTLGSISEVDAVIVGGSIALTGYAPVVEDGYYNVAIPTGTITLTGNAPQASDGVTDISLPTGTITLSGTAPQANDGATNDSYVPTGTITLTGTSFNIYSLRIHQGAFTTQSEIPAYIESYIEFTTQSDFNTYSSGQQIKFTTQSELPAYQISYNEFTTQSELAARTVYQAPFVTQSGFNLYLGSQVSYTTQSALNAYVENWTRFTTQSFINIYMAQQIRFISQSALNIYNSWQSQYNTQSALNAFISAEIGFNSQSALNIYSIWQVPFVTESMLLTYFTGRYAFNTQSAINIYNVQQSAYNTQSALLCYLPQQAEFTTQSFLDALTKYYGYIMNLVTGVVSKAEGSGYGFNSLSRTVGSDESGIYTLDGNTDNLGVINSFVSSGKLDFGSNKHKRVLNAYVSVDGGSTKLTLTDELCGSVPYTITATSQLSNRRKVTAKKPQGRYWQVKIENVNGSQAKVDDIELNVVQLSRHV